MNSLPPDMQRYVYNTMGYTSNVLRDSVWSLWPKSFCVIEQLRPELEKLFTMAWYRGAA